MSDVAAVQPDPATGLSLSRLLAFTGTESDTPATRAIGFLLVAAQFAVVLFLVQRFRLEDDRFLLVVRAGFAGFLIHHFLPSLWRLPFFVTLSLGTVGYFLGLRQNQWQPEQALWRMGLLLGVGLILIGICHLPLSFAKRVGLLVLVCSALALLRSGWISIAHLNAIWPILGAMFMFRLIVYLVHLYDMEREHAPAPARLSRTLSYFFLFPNLWLFVFPVIDYKTFYKSYFNDRPCAIYQKGLGWMMRGIVQLLIWRLFYYHVYLDPARISSGAELVQYMLANVALYLRISGQFHFVIGLLHLFGFNLPETNRRYFLASSFTDYWRRVNIYWKDFIVNVFYYPLVVQFKSWGKTGSVVGGVAFCFVLTWLLHSYQWFWLRGDFPITAKDALFWGLLGALVIASTVWDLNRGRQRKPKQQVNSWSSVAGLGLRTVGTFGVITVLWSIWSCDSVEQWVGLWRYFDTQALMNSMAVLASIGIAAAVLESPGSRWKSREQTTQKIPPLPWRMAAMGCFLPAVLIIGATGRAVNYYPVNIQYIIANLFINTPNKSDQEYMVRSYYENLGDVSRVNVGLASAGQSTPADWIRLDDSSAVRDVRDLRIRELVPSKDTVVNGTLIRTNRWGMRDRDYDLEKPPGTYRIALLGSSIVMGWMVEKEKTFDDLVEERLNREHRGGPWERYEVLNFAANRYSPLSQIEVLKKQALQFKPDAVFLVTHRADPRRCGRILGSSVRTGVLTEYPYLQEVAAKAGFTPKTPISWDDRLLSPHFLELNNWGYQQIAAICKQAGIEAVSVYIPSIASSEDPSLDPQLMDLATKAGFTNINLLGIFDKSSFADITVAPWDDHPNVKGHKLMADRLYGALTTTKGLGLGIAEHTSKRPVSGNSK